MTYKFPIKVRGHHIDVYQHVNNAVYLTFLEDARWEMFDQSQALAWMEERDLGFVVVNINIDYHAAAYMNDDIEVHTEFQPITQGKRSGKLEQTIYRGDKRLAKAAITYVCIDLKKERALPLEGELYQRIEQLRNPGELPE